MRLGFAILASVIYWFGLEAGAQSGAAIELHYDIYWKGFRVFTLSSNIRIDQRGYRHKSTMETRGVLRLFVRGRSETLSAGRLRRGGRELEARDFLTSGKWNGDVYSRELRFRADGRMRSLDVDMPEEWMNREPVPRRLQRGPDPQSLITWALTDPWGIIGRGRDLEAGPFNSFDGIRAIKYMINCEAETRMIDTPRTFFEGEVNICVLTGKQVAGFWRGDDDTATDEEREYTDQTMTFWLARPAGRSDVYVPVRLDILSRRGLVHAYLKESSVELLPTRMAGQ